MSTHPSGGRGSGASLDQPPPSDRYVDLPESFGRRFAVFVDTEEEFDWSKPLSRDNRSTSAMAALPAIHARLAQRGVKPAYLVDHPIVTDPLSVEILADLLRKGECTIGTQLHPWVNPPFEEEVNGFNSFAGNLPVELERAKLLVLTDAIENAFGVRPTVYRAGRYGIGPNTAGLLREAGYKVDCSVRALYDYRSGDGPDFRGFEPRPFWVDEPGGLLEVPLSAAYIGLARKAGRPLSRLASRIPRGPGLLARSGLVEKVSLTPEEMPLDKVLAALRRMLDDGVRLFSISFHSPSAEPGHTPYVRSAADLGAFHAWWDGVLDFLEAEGVQPASIDEIHAAISAASLRRTACAG